MVFVIAECGVNWRDLVDADQMIKAAAEAGADACKFQCYEPNFIQYGDSVINAPQGRYIPHLRANELNSIYLDESTIRYLYWRCQQHGIEFMCTPFYQEAVKMLDPFVKRWKVRFADNLNLAILLPIVATKKEMLISRSFIPIGAPSDPLVKNLYCCSEYPPGSLPEEIKFNGFDGYSCHTPWVKDMVNVGRRVQYLEVHVRLDHYEPPHYCPIDTSVSITMSELAELCRRLKQ